ncbi:MAG: hypothetical protein WCA22_15280, partial [Candidatus Binatus sp.]
LIGLVAEVVPLADLDGRALALARAFGRVTGEQAAMLKLAVWGGLDMPLRQGLELERRLWKRLAKI